MRQLSLQEVGDVSGAISSDAAYGGALGAAGGFLGIALGAAAAITPLGMGILLGASIISSGIAIYAAMQ